MRFTPQSTLALSYESESQRESGFTQGSQVPVICQHHLPAQGSLRRRKVSPFCPGEVESQILEGHHLLKQEVPAAPEPILWLRASVEHRGQCEVLRDSLMMDGK